MKGNADEEVVPPRRVGGYPVVSVVFLQLQRKTLQRRRQPCRGIKEGERQ